MEIPGFKKEEIKLELELENDPLEALKRTLPGGETLDLYRITLKGPSDPIDMEKLRKEFDRFPNLVLRNETTKPVDPWIAVGEDSFEGMYFGLLKEKLGGADEEQQAIVELAAKISRQVLDGREVKLP